MYSKMNTQELKLADNYLGLLEFLPMSVQRNIIERLFEKHNHIQRISKLSCYAKVANSIINNFFWRLNLLSLTLF
jgi:hypothetical protein